jgi:hypothetical protein
MEKMNWKRLRENSIFREIEFLYSRTADKQKLNSDIYFFFKQSEFSLSNP